MVALLDAHDRLLLLNVQDTTIVNPSHPIPDTFWVNGQRVVGHSGGFAGVSANLDMYLESGYTVVVLSNYDRGAQLVNRKTQQRQDSRAADRKVARGAPL